jgi:hypothetical protein
MNPDVRKAKKIYLSISTLSPIDPVAITDIFTQRAK